MKARNAAGVFAASFAVGFTAAAVYGLSRKNQALSGLTTTPRYRIKGPMVSVVIPTLQEEDYLAPLLLSAVNQTYEPLEVVVSDSSPPESKESTAELIERFSGFLDIRMVDAPRKNVSLGRNTGAAASQGDLLLFIDADCIMEPAYIEKLATDLAAGARLAHGIDCWYDADFKNSLKSFYTWYRPRLHTTGRGIMIRRADFELAGGYREDYDPATTPFREDLEFGDRIEKIFGTGAVRLNSGAVVAEAMRRPLFSSSAGKVWNERGWRRGVPINRRLAMDEFLGLTD